MNRWLSIPAVCCVVVFSAVYALLYGSLRGESVSNLRQPALAIRGEKTPVQVASHSPVPHDAPLLSVDQAERSLVSLRDAWLRPWRQRESSPHRLYSRVAPR